jgi:hypothetical protein
MTQIPRKSVFILVTFFQRVCASSHPGKLVKIRTYADTLYVGIVRLKPSMVLLANTVSKGDIYILHQSV